MVTERRRLAAEAWAALLRAHATLVPVMDRAVQAGAGLPLSWYDVLLELAAAPDRRLRMSELGERVVLSRTRVSRIVDELVEAGLVSREPNPDDARSAFARLTPLGSERYRKAAPHYLSAVEDHLAGALSDAQLRALGAALRRLVPDLHDLGPTRRSR